MSYQAADVTGVVRTFFKNDKISSIDGENKTLYFSSIEGGARATNHKPKRLVDPASVVIYPFISLNASGVPSYGTPYTIKAQIHWKEEDLYDAESGKIVGKTKGFLLFKHAPSDNKRRIVIVKFSDSQRAYSFSDQWSCELVLVTYPNADDYGNTGIASESQRQISIEDIKMQENTKTEDGVTLMSNQAMVSIPRDQVTFSELRNRNNYFNISLNGNLVGRFRISAEKDGYCFEKTHHFNIYLTKVV